MENKGYKGNGLAFYKALRSSDKSSEEVRLAMNVSNGTFYRMLKKEVWTDYEKELAGKALDLDWQIMFGLKPKDVTESEKNSAKDDQYQETGTKLGVHSIPPNKPADYTPMNDTQMIIIKTLAETVKSQQETIEAQRIENQKLRAGSLNYKKTEKEAVKSR